MHFGYLLVPTTIIKFGIIKNPVRSLNTVHTDFIIVQAIVQLFLTGRIKLFEAATHCGNGGQKMKSQWWFGVVILQELSLFSLTNMRMIWKLDFYVVS